MHKAHYLYNKLRSLDNYEVMYTNNLYNEFVLKCRDSKDTVEQLKHNNLGFGVDLGVFYPELENHLLINVTELISKSEMDRLFDVMRGL